jgi:hypothetical protein
VTSCTDYYVHLDLLECITTAQNCAFLVTFSISGREVALILCANLRQFAGSLQVRANFFLSFAISLSIFSTEMFCEAL